MKPIESDIVIDAPAEVVWRTITEPDQIVQWFADRVELNARPGGAGVLDFTTMSEDLVVETVDRPHRFSFRWGEDKKMLVEFTLVAEAAERTRLRVVETGLDDLAWPDERKVAYVDDHNEGWAHHFGRLQSLLG